jgi:nickel-dependent lactate racemase
MDVVLPYGRTGLETVLPNSERVNLVRPIEWPEVDEAMVLRDAFAEPRGCGALSALARDSENAVLVTCDKTRGVPSRLTFPLILNELTKGRIDLQDIEILVATGLHKGETLNDVRERFGDLPSEVKIKIHDSDNSELIELGSLTSGTPLVLNSAVVESDLVIVESLIEPHFFAGYTGGSKVILPGVAGTKTILGNHNWEKIDNPKSRYGVLDNPVRVDGNEALRYLNKAFAVNVILGLDKKVVFATVGDPIDSFNLAASKVSEHSTIPLNYSPGVIITTNGGYPLDRNVYQCVKGIAVPEQVLGENSKIVMVSECSDGVEHENFFNILSSGSISEIYERLRTAAETVPDQWEAQVLCRIMQKAPVWFVTKPELRSEIEDMKMHYAPTVEDALREIPLREEDTVLIIPNGPSTILTKT